MKFVRFRSSRPGTTVLSEVVGFVDATVLLMPLDEIDGIGPGCLVRPTGKTLQIEVSDELLGTTLDGLEDRWIKRNN